LSDEPKNLPIAVLLPTGIGTTHSKGIAILVPSFIFGDEIT
jgi:hypothetical protein